MEAPKFKKEISPHYRTIVVSGVFGGHRPGWFEMIIFTDEIDPESLDPALSGSRVVVKRTFQCRLILDPIQAKSLLQWLTYHVKEYEKKFGEIKMPPAPSTRGRSSMFV